MLEEMINSPETWPIVLVLCSLVLLVEAGGIFKALLATRQARWRFFLVLIPLVACIWSFANGIQALSVLKSTFSSVPIHLHLTPSIYLAVTSKVRMVIENCQLQTGIAGGAFILSLLLEKVLHMPYVSFLIHIEKAA